MEPTLKAGQAVTPKPAETNGQAAPPAPELNGAFAAGPAPLPAPRTKHWARQVLERLADLRITVALFALSLVLVFWGTLAQVDNGVWTVVQKYFRTPIAWVPLKVVFFNSIDEKTEIPFPGGWLIGTVMLVNLLAAHAIRFKLTWNRAGIFMIHAGIILMMLGEFITGLYAVEGNMSIHVGETSSSVVDNRNAELAIVRTLDATTDDVVTVPGRFLRKPGSVVDNDKSPFRIEVVEYMTNSRVVDQKNHVADKGFGRLQSAEELPETSGVDKNDTVDVPSMYAKLYSRNGKSLGTWLFSIHFGPQWVVDDDGTKYKVALRFKQTERKFKLHLTNFKHDVFPGTNIPKDYHSYVRLIDPETGVDRPVEIYMNAPLYYRGETFYQASLTSDGPGTVLQVVRNPGWLLPYLSCGIVGVGLLLHFGNTLYRFIERRSKK